MAAGLLGCKPAAFSLCYKIFAFAFVLSFLHTMKKGSKHTEFCISACDDFKRRVRRCRFPRAAFDFSPVEIRHRHTSKSVQFCAERVRFAKCALQFDNSQFSIHNSQLNNSCCKSRSCVIPLFQARQIVLG